MSQASSLVSLNLGVSNARHLRQERHRSGAVTSRPSIRALADTVPCSARRRWGLPASPLQGHSCPPCRWETLAFWAVRSDFTNPASHDAVGVSAASARLPVQSGRRRATAAHSRAGSGCRGSPCGLPSAFFRCVAILPGALPCVWAEGASGSSRILPAPGLGFPFRELAQGLLAACSGTWWLEAIFTLHSWVRVLVWPWKTKSSFHGYAFPLYRKAWHRVLKRLVLVGVNSCFQAKASGC